MNLRKYLLHSTVLCAFSEAFLFRVGFDFKLFYILVLVNYLLMFLNYRMKFSKRINIILFLIFIIGFLTVFLFGNQIGRVFSQVIGIAIIANFFYAFFKLNLDTPINIFKLYCRYSYIVSLIGILFFFLYLFHVDVIGLMIKYLPFGYPGTTGTFRLQSIMLEPAHFAGVVLPAYFYYLNNIKKRKKQFFVIFTALVLSFSSVAYLGMLVCFLILKSRNPLKKISLVAFGAAFATVVYFYSENVKLRVDDSFQTILSNGRDLGDVNLSTYALFSNVYVAKRVFLDSPIIGHGIGSHPISHKKYVKQIDSGEVLERLDLVDINSEDANSLFLRIISELGLLGLISVCLFIYKYYTNDGTYVSQSILIYFLYKLLREGHYFSPEMYLFVMLYLFVNYKYKARSRSSNKNNYASEEDIATNKNAENSIEATSPLTKSIRGILHVTSYWQQNILAGYLSKSSTLSN